MSIEKINGLPLRDGHKPLTKIERVILGIIESHVSELEFGRLSLDISVRRGKVCHVDCSGIKKSYNIESLEKP